MYLLPVITYYFYKHNIVFLCGPFLKMALENFSLCLLDKIFVCFYNRWKGFGTTLCCASPRLCLMTWGQCMTSVCLVTQKIEVLFLNNRYFVSTTKCLLNVGVKFWYLMLTLRVAFPPRCVFNLLCVWASNHLISASYFFEEYAEKYQELLVKQDFFHDAYGENGNEV